MRVLTFIHSFDPGGVERVALRLVRQWREAGADAPLFVGRPEGAMLGDVGQGLDFFTPPQPRLGSGWCETLWMIAQLPAAIRRFRPDVLFCPGNTYSVVAAAMKLHFGAACPPILAKISNDLEWADKPAWARFFYRLWLRLQGRCFAGAVAMEAAMVPEICRYLALPAARVSVVPDPALTAALAAELAAATPLAWREGAPRRFVSVGRLVRQKNLPLMLRAFARGAGAGDTLDLIGEGPEHGALLSLIAALGLEARVRLVGYRPEPALDLNRYHAILLSSDFEGVPAVLLEAMAAGLAIVSTRCSASVNSLLEQGALGALTPIGDEAAFAAALAAVRPGVQDRAALAARARRFTVEVSAPAYLRFAAALAGHGAPHPAAAEPVEAAAFSLKSFEIGA